MPEPGMGSTSDVIPASNTFADGLFGVIKSVSNALNRVVSGTTKGAAEYTRKFEEATAPLADAVINAGRLTKDVGELVASVQGKNPHRGPADEIYSAGERLERAGGNFRDRTGEATASTSARASRNRPIVSASRGKANLSAMEKRILADKKLDEEEKIKRLNQLAKEAYERKKKATAATPKKKKAPKRGDFRRRR